MVEKLFSHLPSYREVDCRLRVPKPEGQLYETEEEARKQLKISNWLLSISLNQSLQ